MGIWHSEATYLPAIESYDNTRPLRGGWCGVRVGGVLFQNKYIMCFILNHQVFEGCCTAGPIY